MTTHHRHKGDKYIRISFLGRRVELYLGLMGLMGFNLDIEQRHLMIRFFLIALYIMPWKNDWEGDVNKNHAYGLEMTPTNLIYGHFYNRVFLVGWPWSLQYLYTKKLRPVLQIGYLPFTASRERIRSLPSKYWYWDRQPPSLIRILRYIYRIFEKGYEPWMRSSYATNLDETKGEKVHWWDLPTQTWEYPYEYTLKSGEIQKRTARISLQEWGYCPWFLAWTDIPLVKRTGLQIDFSDEVGERTGSWKGGVIGTGETMRRGETIYDTFKRFQRDRKFN